MTMRPLIRCRYWSVLQVAAIVVCYRGKVTSEFVQGCVRSELSLRCPEMKVIQITSVFLGDTYCHGTSCCVENNDCTYVANANHRTEIIRRCDNKQNCTVKVLQEKIPCGYWGVWYRNDFERITYNCKNKARNYTMNPATERPTENGNYTNPEERDKENEPPMDQEWQPAVMVTIGLILLLAIVILVVVMYRRKKRAHVRLHPVAMPTTQNDIRQNRTGVHENEIKGTSLNDPLLLYSLLDEPDFSTTDEDPAVCSQVVKKKPGRKESQSSRITTDKTKAAIDVHIARPDVYSAVSKSSKTPAIYYSALKTDHAGGKGLVNKGDLIPNQIYSLATQNDDTADIYANESTDESPMQLAGTVSSLDDEDHIVTENDLYCH